MDSAVLVVLVVVVVRFARLSRPEPLSLAMWSSIVEYSTVQYSSGQPTQLKGYSPSCFVVVVDNN